MLRFKEFLAEMFLLEGKIDDLKAQNPSLHREIDQYAAADLSPTKKFVPWLVSQHKRGNVTPDHPDLHQVLGNYDKYKNIHGIKDHTSKTFQEVHSTIMPLIGTGSTTIARISSTKKYRPAPRVSILTNKTGFVDKYNNFTSLSGWNTPTIAMSGDYSSGGYVLIVGTPGIIPGR